jgi:hypothetical protein
MTDEQFRKTMRMSRDAFAKLLRIIQRDRVFHNQSRNRQTPIKIQLAVTLYRLGTTGNGVSIQKLAMHWGISPGAVLLFTSRVFNALLAHQRRWIAFPEANERARISKRIGESLGFDGCVGFVDGMLTKIPS